MKRTDYRTCVDAIREARRILGRYIEPAQPRDAAATINRIMEVLDNDDIDAALNRIDGRDHFRLVEFQ
jgi:hypothetical protein